MEWYVLQALTGREQDARAALECAGLDARVPTELRPIHKAGPMDRTRVHAPAWLCIRWDGF